MKQISKVLLLMLCFIISCNITYAKTKTAPMEKDSSYDKYQELSEEDKRVFIEPLEYVNVDNTSNQSIEDLVNADFYLSASNQDASYNYNDTFELKNYFSNGTTGLKNQGSINVCWSFATCNAIESYLAKHGITNNGKKYNLSEDYLEYVSFQNIFNERLTNKRSPSNFGSSNTQTEVATYLAYGFAPITEDIFGSYSESYSPAKNTSAKVADFNNTALDITGVRVYNSAYSSVIPSIKKQIVENGGIYTGIFVQSNSNSYGFHNNQYDKDYHFLYNSTPVQANHAVTLVGWDNNYRSPKFPEAGAGAWIAVNSWGTKESLFYISYNDKSLLEAFMGITGVKDKSWTNAYKKVGYTNDGNASIYEFQLDKPGEYIHSVKVLIMAKNYEDENPAGSLTVTIANSNGSAYCSASDCAIYQDTYQGVNTFDYSSKHIQASGNRVYVKLSKHIEGAKNTVILYTRTPVYYGGLNLTGPDYKKVDLGTKASTFKSNLLTYSGVSIGSSMKNASGGTIANTAKLSTGNYIEVSYTRSATAYSTSNYATITKKIYAVVNGDINCDGEVEANDYILIKKHIMAKSSFDLLGNSIKYSAADYDNNNDVNALDYIKMKKDIMNR